MRWMVLLLGLVGCSVPFPEPLVQDAATGDVQIGPLDAAPTGDSGGADAHGMDAAGGDAVVEDAHLDALIEDTSITVEAGPDALYRDQGLDVAIMDAAPDVPLDAAPDVPLDAAPDVPLDAAPDVPLDAAPDVLVPASACEAAEEMPVSGWYYGSTADLPDEHGTSCRRRSEGGEAVFSFRVQAPSRVFLNTNNSSFDTVLSVRTDCADLATEVACNDDAGSGDTSYLSFNAVADTQYFALVDGYDGESGDVTLNYLVSQACPCGEEQVCLNQACYPRHPEACSDAIAGTGPGNYVGDTSLSANRHTPSAGCLNGPHGSNAPEAVLAFTVRERHRLQIDTSGSQFDTVLYIMSECDHEIACNDDSDRDRTSRLRVDVVPGQVYYIVVDGYNQEQGAFNLNIR